MNPITEMLGCKYPIIQGAMAGISNPEMVAAVSEAGGYGLLASAGMWGPEKLTEQLKAVRKLTDKPFGVNLIAMNPNSGNYAGLLADFGIKAVTTSAGSPAKLIPILHEKGIKAIHVVPTAAYAVIAEEAGADAVVAEGTESGGMQGHDGVSTMVLIPAVVDAMKIPVIAAGGIVDSRGYRAALALGAVGVQVGTAFMASKECIIHGDVKNLLVEAAETDTVLLRRGRICARAVRTPYVKENLENASETPSSYRGDWVNAAIEGDISCAALPAGQCIGLLRSVRSVKEIIEEMVS